jgi:hypothetical protein
VVDCCFKEYQIGFWDIDYSISNIQGYQDYTQSFWIDDDDDVELFL